MSTTPPPIQQNVGNPTSGHFAQPFFTPSSRRNGTPGLGRTPTPTLEVERRPEYPPGTREMTALQILEHASQFTPLTKILQETKIQVPSEDHDVYYDFFSVVIIYDNILYQPSKFAQFCSFLEEIDNPQLRRRIENTMYDASRTLISCDYDSSPMNPRTPRVAEGLSRFNVQGTQVERDKLFLLGTFIGRFVILRNRAIPNISLDLKHILQHAYQYGKLHLVLPFVVEILRFCPDSQAFSSIKQPWVLSLLHVIAEIADLPLQNQLVASITLLCDSFLKLSTSSSKFQKSDNSGNGDLSSPQPLTPSNQHSSFLTQFQDDQKILKPYPLVYDLKRGQDFIHSELQKSISRGNILVSSRCHLIYYSPAIERDMIHRKDYKSCEVTDREPGICLSDRAGTAFIGEGSPMFDLFNPQYPGEHLYTNQLLKLSVKTSSLRFQASHFEATQLLPHLPKPAHQPKRTPTISQFFSLFPIEVIYHRIQNFVYHSSITCYSYICKKIYPVVFNVLCVVVFKDAAFSFGSDKNTFHRCTLTELEASHELTQIDQLESVIMDGLERLAALEAYTLTINYLLTRPLPQIVQELDTLTTPSAQQKPLNQETLRFYSEHKNELGNYLIECLLDDYTYLLVDHVTHTVCKILHQKVKMALDIRAKFVKQFGENGIEEMKKEVGSKIDVLSAPLLSSFYLNVPYAGPNLFPNIPSALEPVGVLRKSLIADVQDQTIRTQPVSNDPSSLHSDLHQKLEELLSCHPRSLPHRYMRVSVLPNSLLTVFHSPIIRDAAHLLPHRINVEMLKESEIIPTTTLPDFFKIAIHEISPVDKQTPLQFEKLIYSVANDVKDKLSAVQADLSELQTEILLLLSSLAVTKVDLDLVITTLRKVDAKLPKVQQASAAEIKQFLSDLVQAVQTKNEPEKRRNRENLQNKTINISDALGKNEKEVIKKCYGILNNLLAQYNSQFERKTNRFFITLMNSVKIIHPQAISDLILKHHVPQISKTGNTAAPSHLIHACCSVANLLFERFVHHNATIFTDILLSGPPPIITVHYNFPSNSIQAYLDTIKAAIVHHKVEDCPPSLRLTHKDSDLAQYRPLTTFLGHVSNETEKNLFHSTGKAYAQTARLPTPNFNVQILKESKVEIDGVDLNIPTDPLFSFIDQQFSRSQALVSEAFQKTATEDSPRPTPPDVRTIVDTLSDELYNPARKPPALKSHHHTYLFIPCCIHRPARELLDKKKPLREMSSSEVKELSDVQILLMALLPSIEIFPETVRELYISCFMKGLQILRSLSQTATRAAVNAKTLHHIFNVSPHSIVQIPPLPRSAASIVINTDNSYGSQPDFAELSTVQNQQLSVLTLGTNHTTKIMNMFYANHARTLFSLLRDGFIESEYFFGAHRVCIFLLWKASIYLSPIEREDETERTITKPEREPHETQWDRILESVPKDGPPFVAFLQTFVKDQRGGREKFEDFPYWTYVRDGKSLFVKTSISHADNTITLRRAEPIIIPTLVNYFLHHVSLLSEFLLILLHISVPHHFKSQMVKNRQISLALDFNDHLITEYFRPPTKSVVPIPQAYHSNPAFISILSPTPNHQPPQQSNDGRQLLPPQPSNDGRQLLPHPLLFDARELIDLITMIYADWEIMVPSINRCSYFSVNQTYKFDVDLVSLLTQKLTDLTLAKPSSPHTLNQMITFWQMPFYKQRNFTRPSDDDDLITTGRTISSISTLLLVVNYEAHISHSLISFIRATGLNQDSVTSIRLSHESIVEDMVTRQRENRQELEKAQSTLTPNPQAEQLHQLNRINQTFQRISSDYYQALEKTVPSMRQHIPLQFWRKLMKNEQVQNLFEEYKVLLKAAYGSAPPSIYHDTLAKFVSFVIDVVVDVDREEITVVQKVNDWNQWVPSPHGDKRRFVFTQAKDGLRSETMPFIQLYYMFLNRTKFDSSLFKNDNIHLLAEPVYRRYEMPDQKEVAFYLDTPTQEWEAFRIFVTALYDRAQIAYQNAMLKRSLHQEEECSQFMKSYHQNYELGLRHLMMAADKFPEYFSVNSFTLLHAYEHDRENSYLRVINRTGRPTPALPVTTNWDAELLGFIRRSPPQRLRNGLSDDAQNRLVEAFSEDAKIRCYLSYAIQSVFFSKQIDAHAKNNPGLYELLQEIDLFIREGTLDLVHFKSDQVDTAPKLVRLYRSFLRAGQPNNSLLTFLILWLCEKGGYCYFQHLQLERLQMSKLHEQNLDHEINPRTHVFEYKQAVNIMSLIFFGLTEMKGVLQDSPVKVILPKMLNLCMAPSPLTSFVSNTLFFILLGGDFGALLRAETEQTRNIPAEAHTGQPNSFTYLNDIILAHVVSRLIMEDVPWGIRQMNKTLETRKDIFGSVYAQFKKICSDVKKRP
ncbi:putative CCR4-NOT transcription complex subunit 1 CAF1-binding domain containing protein [Blattamonas nauphoetae]|uniref:CCR4-NOT transcription complex subunit 1 CAF1-binding domain containing protein n=1 Tax=Blattamonas nauphoetae TaxID=2049346 RepID=A0ABQ9XYX2_9EUKA|nr:putative CCR4-NOT transcription complex subunit 1 CAF1-binding domain containing protein [Blattamonas nauphoetae]